MPSGPPFFVVARVVGRDGAIESWKQRLIPLCEVSVTEPLGNTYYWGQDLDGEPDTLWGLEGYSHAVGFFIGHPSSKVFKEEMALVDSDKLLRNEQGLTSKDYDLKHYDQAGGYLTREDDEEKNRKDSFIAVIHFWVKGGGSGDVINKLGNLADATKELGLEVMIQSCAVFKGVWDQNLVTLWVRSVSSTYLPKTYTTCVFFFIALLTVAGSSRTKTEKDFDAFKAWDRYKTVVDGELKSGGDLIGKTEVHRSKAFNGHIDK
ncbi:uncharacterized protein PAC_19151 [Phialocephala subalpina]|uniref:ABM domain-containing protein n=1 Tax=Phialocephala subalpina TaxID=576137 RepID=A0A1L7XW39_9HELO|nr:uncharacterized protein PAC_19151 [Phialocephala subalpina]